MFRLWGKIWKDNHLLKDTVICDDSGNNYYVLSGQENPKQNDSLEVFRITKYDKNWNKIKSCGLYGDRKSTRLNSSHSH